jgi:endo-1,4-beta-xylanase
MASSRRGEAAPAGGSLLRLGLRLPLLAALVIAALLTLATDAAPASQPPGLRFYAEAKGKEVGTAVQATPLFNEPIYADTLSREFDVLIPENEMKWDSLEPQQGVFDFTVADSMVAYAEAHQMQVFGQMLVWGYTPQLPAWLTQGNFTRDQLMDILHNYITTVVGHYSGKVEAWDVVNEAIADDPPPGTPQANPYWPLKDTFWSEGIGPDYVEMAFRWAREADPNVLLYYNDYNGEAAGGWQQAKSDRIYNLVEGLKQDGVPVDGVGLQMHTSIAWPPAPQDVAANIERLAALGLEVRITEMDVRIQDLTGPLSDRLNAQAKIFGDEASVCMAEPACKAFMTWGFTDKYSWIPWFTGHPDAALLFDESYQPKPAYYAVLTALSGPIPVGGVAEPPLDSETPQSSGSGGRLPVAAVALAGAVALGGVAWRVRRRSRT